MGLPLLRFAPAVIGKLSICLLLVAPNCALADAPQSPPNTVSVSVAAIRCASDAISSFDKLNVKGRAGYLKDYVVKITEGHGKIFVTVEAKPVAKATGAPHWGGGGDFACDLGGQITDARIAQ